MATKNDITGDPLISKSPTESYRDGWDRIFGQKKQLDTDETDIEIPEVLVKDENDL